MPATVAGRRCAGSRALTPRREGTPPAPGPARRNRPRARPSQRLRWSATPPRARAIDTPDDEPALLDAARRGDEQALSTLLARHAPALRASLAGRIDRRWAALVSADDVLQQTFTDAFLDIGRFEPRGVGAFAAWLRRLAAHNLTDATRALAAARRGGDRRRVAGGSSADLLLDQVLAGTSTPSQVLAREEAAAALRAAVAALPETWRAVISAYDLQGRPIEQLAAELGRSVGAVYLLRHRALQRLAETLADFATRTG